MEKWENVAFLGGFDFTKGPERGPTPGGKNFGRFEDPWGFEYVGS